VQGGDTFHQKGVLILGNGTNYPVDERGQRVKLTPQSNPAVGTWNQLSSSGVDADGKNGRIPGYPPPVYDPYPYPLHNHQAQRQAFESAIAETYQMQGDQFVPTSN
jgi:hypothetical protein